MVSLTIRPTCFSTVVHETRVTRCGYENCRLLMYRKGLAICFFYLFCRALCSDVVKIAQSDAGSLVSEQL